MVVDKSLYNNLLADVRRMVNALSVAESTILRLDSDSSSTRGTLDVIRHAIQARA